MATPAFIGRCKWLEAFAVVCSCTSRDTIGFWYCDTSIFPDWACRYRAERWRRTKIRQRLRREKPWKRPHSWTHRERFAADSVEGVSFELSWIPRLDAHRRLGEADALMLDAVC